MAFRANVKDRAGNLRFPKTFKEVSHLTKPKLKEVCRTLSIDFEKSVGKKALVNIVCNALDISTSGSGIVEQSSSTATSCTNTPTIKYLQKLHEWQKSLNGIQLLMDESIVKQFLIGVGYNKHEVKKYKTLRAWEHKQGIHSVK